LGVKAVIDRFLEMGDVLPLLGVVYSEHLLGNATRRNGPSVTLLW
jgi:hypothetical protein